MLCPKCNTEISDGMLFCPECGTKLEAPKPETPVAETPVVETPVVETPVAETPAPEAPKAAPVFDQPAFQLNTQGAEPEKPKKDPKKKKTIIRITALITALALIITGVLGFVFGDWGTYIGNFFNRMKPAEDYKADVELAALADPDAMNEIGAAKKAFMDYYRALKAGQQYSSADAGLKLLMGEDAQDFMEGLGQGLMLDEELVKLLQQLEELELRVDYGIAEEGMLAKIDLGLNGVNLATLDMLMDWTKGEVFMGLPGLVDGYAKVSAQDMGMEKEMLESYSKLMQISKDWVEKLPEPEKVEALIDRCITAGVNQITQVEKSEKTLSVGDVEQKVTVLTYELTEQDAIDVAKAVLKELEGDETVMELLEAYAYMTNELNGAYRDMLPEMEDVYPTVDPEEAMDAITEAINELEDYEPEDEGELKIDTFVNNKGQIIGRKFRFPEDLGEISYMTLQDGDKLAFQVFMDMEEEELEFTFEGEKKNDKLTGTGYLDHDGDEYIVVKLEDFDLNARTGKLRIELGKSLQKQLKDEMGAAAALAISGLALDFEIEADGFTMWLSLAKQQLLGLKLDYSMSNEKPEFKVPANATTDLEAWAATLDPQALLDNLEKAGISQEMLMALIGAIEEGGSSIL